MSPDANMMLMTIRRMFFIMTCLADLVRFIEVMATITMAGTNGLADRLLCMILMTDRRTNPSTAASKLLSGKADKHRK